MIQLIGLSKTYHTANRDVCAIEDINLQIEDGDIFGIIGLSGAGKSTLVRCINYLEKPTAGKVVFDGTDLSELSDKELRQVRKKISMIFQGFNLLNQRTVLGNVCFPLELIGIPKKQAEEKALGLLETVGLSDRAKYYPSQLSGGQKQRVAIARALATDPKVILCDEATSALDPTTTRTILELLKEINRKLGVTIVVITHEMKVVEAICNRVAVLDLHHVAEEGLVSDIFTHPQSAIARELILPQTNRPAENKLAKDHTLRIVFDGVAADEPILSQMVLQCNVNVNIMAADTKTIDGKTYGQMLFQLPESPEDCQRIRDYLNSREITFSEEEGA